MSRRSEVRTLTSSWERGLGGRDGDGRVDHVSSSGLSAQGASLSRDLSIQRHFVAQLESLRQRCLARVASPGLSYGPGRHVDTTGAVCGVQPRPEAAVAAVESDQRAGIEHEFRHPCMSRRA